MRLRKGSPLPPATMQQNPLPGAFRGSRQAPVVTRLQQYRDPENSYLGKFQPDVAARQEVRNARATPANPPVPPSPVQTTALPILMTDLSGTIVVAGTAQLAIPQNDKRQRFIMVNPLAAPSVLFFSFKNSPNSQIALNPGEIYNETGPAISIDEIWVQSSVVGHNFGAYEGVAKP